MTTLASIYSELFTINTGKPKNIEDISLNESWLVDHDFPITKNNQNLLNNLLYYLFIHMLVGFKKSELGENLKKLKIQSTSKTLINNELADMFSSRDISLYELKKISVKDITITIKENSFCKLKEFLTGINYFSFDNNDFISDLTSIQFLDIIKDSKILNLNNLTKQRKYGQYYTPQKVTEFMVKNTFNFIQQETKLRLLDPSSGSGLFISSIIKNLKVKDDRIKDLFVQGIDIDYKALLTGSFIIELMKYSPNSWQNNFNVNLSLNDFLLFNSSEIGGFDVIIGNPPYIRERNFNKDYRKNLSDYKTYKGKSDIYFAFIERSYSLLKEGGLLNFILPRYWLESDFGKNIRKFIVNHFSIRLIIDFRSYKVFTKGVHSVILVCQKISSSTKINENTFDCILVTQDYQDLSLENTLSNIDKLLNAKSPELPGIEKFSINQSQLGSNWSLDSPEKSSLLQKLSNISDLKLEDIAIIKEGINTGADKVSKKHIETHEKMKLRKGEGIYVLTEKEVEKLGLTTHEKEKYVKKWIKGKDVRKWIVHTQTHWLLYFKDLPEQNNKILTHLLNYKKILENRAEIKRNKRRKWYELAWPREGAIFETKPKLLIPYKSKVPMVAIDEHEMYTSADFRIVTVKEPYNPLVILAILNSELISWYLKQSTKKLGLINDYYSYNLSRIPIIYPEQEIANKIEKLVEKIISDSTIKNLNRSGIEQENTLIEKNESELNDLIKSLYGLTEAERHLIKLHKLK